MDVNKNLNFKAEFIDKVIKLKNGIRMYKCRLHAPKVKKSGIKKESIEWYGGRKIGKLS